MAASDEAASLPVGGRPLLERERELATLAGAVEQAAAGEARVALVEGPAGIGKTELLAETRRRAVDAGLDVLSARGGELEREFPFGVVRQLFEPVLADPEGRQRALAGAANSARSVFEDVDGASRPNVIGDTSFAVLHGLFWLTVNLSAERSVVLAIDDLHWCDQPSLRFLAYLVRRIERLPIAVVCSVRPAEPGVDSALLGEIAHDPLAVSLQPRPLSEGGVADLVRARLGEEADAAFCAACHAATGGNPLLLSELLKALDVEGVEPDARHVDVVAELGPRAASRAVLLRLARLPADAVPVARAIAVLGDAADLSTVAALAGVDEPQAARATGHLTRAEILRPETPLGFVHPLVRGAVYRDLPPGERELQHQRAATLLTDSAAPVQQVAAQLIATPPHGEPWVVETLRRAAREALQKGAPESASAYLERARAEPPADEERPHVALELGTAEALTSGPAAADHLREAYEALTDPLARGLTAQLLGRALMFTGSPEEGAEVARRAAAELPPELDDLRRALEAFELVVVFWGAGDRTALRRLEAYRAVDRAAGAGAKMLAGLAALDWTYAGGTADACAGLALDALAGGDLVAADPNLLAIAATMVLMFADRDEALDAWDEALGQAHRHGSLFAVSGNRMWRGYTLLRRGELADAEDELRTAFEEFELWGYGRTAHTYCNAFLALALLERGKTSEAKVALGRGADPESLTDGVRYWLNARLELEVADGPAEEAVATADEIARRWPDVVNPAVGPWRSLKAQALDRLGRGEEGLALAYEELELARRWGAPGTLGRSLRVVGLLERDRGLERLEEAVEVLAGSPARLEHAKALAALGGALRRARKPTEAREPLRRALKLADVCGAASLAEQVRTELYATGARPRTTALSGVEALTASELRAATLAAEGLTNREIGQTLFVTPKTVEVHLRNAYRKLGIRSRRELAAALTAG